MDEVTQQNSALVEENAATAKTLEHQARAMDERVAYFRIDHAVAVGQNAPPVDVKRAAAPPTVPSRGKITAGRGQAKTGRGAQARCRRER